MRTPYRTTFGAITAGGSTPTRGELEAHIARGARLHAEAVNDFLAAAVRLAERAVRTVSRETARYARAALEMDQSVNPRLPAGDPSQPVKGLLGLFLPDQSWVRHEGRSPVELVSGTNPHKPGRGGRDSRAA